MNNLKTVIIIAYLLFVASWTYLNTQKAVVGLLKSTINYRASQACLNEAGQKIDFLIFKN